MSIFALIGRAFPLFLAAAAGVCFSFQQPLPGIGCFCFAYLFFNMIIAAERS